MDLSPCLIELARRRLPRWSNRLWVGNAVDWVAPDGRRFDYVHTLLEYAPPARRHEMLRHQLARLVAPGGRLLVSQYSSAGASTLPRPAETLRRLGFAVAGESRPRDPDWAGAAATAWIEAEA